MIIEIAIACYYFQKRFSWMLSSILQQTGDIPNLVINVSHTEEDGSPTTKEVCSFFREKGLNIQETILKKQDVNNRAIARNKQLELSKADFILFADADMVYVPDFFADLKYQLKNNLKDEKRCMGADRISLSIPFCSNYFNCDSTKYPVEIKNVASIVEKWPVYYVRGKHIAPGYFQLANLKLAKERNVKYGISRRDGLRRYAADRMFRVNLGGRVAISTKRQFHLNHERSNSVSQN
jgi:glycosyltransferase involved in cell wall biosynthesis